MARYDRDKTLVPFEDRLRGLSLNLRRGETISIDDGQLVIQYIGKIGNQIALKFRDPDKKYKINRGKSCSKEELEVSTEPKE